MLFFRKPRLFAVTLVVTMACDSEEIDNIGHWTGFLELSSPKNPGRLGSKRGSAGWLASRNPLGQLSLHPPDM